MVLDLTLVTPPADTPVSLADVKAFLLYEDDSQDAVLNDLLSTASQELDGYSGGLGRALITQTWRLRLPGFPCAGRIALPLPPLQAVSSVTYLNPDRQTQTLDPALYTVRAGPSGDLALVSGAAWPSTACDARAVTIDFVAGYGDPDDVPQPIRTAIKLRVGALARGRAGGAPDPALAALLSPYRIRNI